MSTKLCQGTKSNPTTPWRAVLTETLTTPPCLPHASTGSGRAGVASPKNVATQQKTVADLANELSPVPSNEPYMVTARSEELASLMVKYTENDSDDETLRAQSGDESSDSRHVSESEGEEPGAHGHPEIPLRHAAERQEKLAHCECAPAATSTGESTEVPAWVRFSPSSQWPTHLISEGNYRELVMYKSVMHTVY